MAFESFESCQRLSDISIDEFLINSRYHVAKLKDYKIHLPEPVLANRALKSANFSLENERLVKAMISEFTLSAMSRQLSSINTVTDSRTKMCITEN